MGIAGSSRDILLSIFALESFARADPETAAVSVFESRHYKFILPSRLNEASAEIAGDVSRFGPDLLGFSTYTWNFDAVIATAERVKRESPNVLIVLGGPEIAASDIAAGRFDSMPVDFLVCGEGEIPFVRLVKCLASHEGTREFRSLPRTAFRVNDRFEAGPLNDPQIDLVQDLSAIPSPYLAGLVPGSLLSYPGVQANIETQRGCNFRCTYCLYHANFPSVRYRNLASVLDEIEYVYRRGVANFRITDANFFSRKAFALQILEGLVDRGIQMSFFVEVIPSYIDERVASILRTYQGLSPGNTILVGIGLQTINAESLRTIRRNLPIRHFDRAFHLLSEAGVVIKTDIILGLPHETKSTYFDLMEYVGEKMRSGFNYLSLALLRLLPGTELERAAAAAGLMADASDSEHFVYETPTMSREELVDCLRVSTVAYRLFHTLDIPSRIGFRGRYFDLKDRTGRSHVSLILELIKFFDDAVRGTTSDWNDPAFRRAEHYWTFDVYAEIPDEALRSEFDRIERGWVPCEQSSPTVRERERPGQADECEAESRR